MIIPEYDENFKNEDYGLDHSYQIEPQGYSEPQILYKFYYSGGTLDVLKLAGTNDIMWSIDYPFYIIDGQGTTGVTIALIPVLTKEREKIITVTGLTQIKYTYRDLKYSILNLKIGKCDNIRWEENLELKYKQGAAWIIEGNNFPIITKNINNKIIPTIETYTIKPAYSQSGNPPKNITNPDSYTFKVKGGRVKKIYGGTAPINGAWINNFLKVDIEWYQSGSTYFSFYSAWSNETLKFPNTLGINVTENKI